jgi:hypothetical protein
VNHNNDGVGLRGDADVRDNDGSHGDAHQGYGDVHYPHDVELNGELD